MSAIKDMAVRVLVAWYPKDAHGNFCALSNGLKQCDCYIFTRSLAHAGALEDAGLLIETPVTKDD